MPATAAQADRVVTIGLCSFVERGSTENVMAVSASAGPGDS
ncbi:hypothetical protein [Streptomyces sp. NBC_00690]|nr:hypothetical protein [Streptomyces sp. NBC_00690]